MRNTFKRVLSFILALTMVLGLGVNAFAKLQMTGTLSVYVGRNGNIPTDEADFTVEDDLDKKVIDVIEGSAHSAEKIKSNDYSTQLAKYTWDGKYWKDAGCTEYFTDADVFESDTNIFVNYVNYCKVDLYVGGEVVKTLKITEKNGKGNYVVSGIPDASDYEIGGVECTGWLVVGYENKNISDGRVVLPGTKTSYDIQAICDVDYKVVTFDANGGALKNADEAQRKVVKDQPVGTLPEVEEREGYKFRGWNANGESGFWNETVVVNDNYTLFARWEAIQYWTITFNPNGGVFANPEEEVRKVVKETAIGELPVVTRAGYAFTGWKMGSTIATEETVPTKSSTAVAQWIPGAYNVYFDNCEEITGKPVGVVAAKNGEAVPSGTFTAWTAPGYDFDGWYSTKEYTEKVNAPAIWNLTENVTYYAKYVPKTYEVEVYLNVYGETDKEYVGKVEFTYGTPYGPDLDVEIPTTYEDHPFLAWYVVGLEGGDKKFSELVELRDEIWKLDAENIKIYAVYSDTVKEYSITYKYPALDEENLGGETVLYYVNGKVDNVPEIEEEYQKLGYTVKWVYEGTDIAVAVNDTIPGNVNAVLKYKINTYNVYFKSNGAWVTNKTANYGQSIKTLLPSLGDIIAIGGSAYVPGYNFLGWELEGKTYAVNCTDVWTFEADKLFNAVWEPAEFTVTLDANGGRFADGTTTKQFQIKTGESYSGKLPENPTKDNGNTFVGWNFDGHTYEVSELENAPFGQNKNITLKAYYTDTVPAEDTTVDIKMIDTWNGAVIYDSKYDLDCYETSAYVGVKKWNTTFNYWFMEDDADQHRLNYARWDAREDVEGLKVYINGSGGNGGRKAEAAKYGYTAGIATSPDGEVLTEAEMIQTITEDTVFYIVYDTTIGYGAILPDESEVIIATYPARLGQKLGDAVPAIKIGDDLSYYVENAGVLPTTNAGLAFNGWFELPDGNNYVGVAVNVPERQAEVVLNAKHSHVGSSKYAGGKYDHVAAIYVAYTNTKDIDAVLDAKGGVFADGQGKNIVKVPYGEDVYTYIYANAPTRVGYTFKNWTLNGTAVYNMAGVKMPNKTTTFEAVWQQKSIKVTFVNAAGAAITGYQDKVVFYDNTIEVLPALSVVPVGQKFVDWVYVDANGNETVIKANDKWAIDADTATITPKFKYIDYTITFDAKDGKFADGTSKKVITAHYGDNVLGLLEETPVCEGYNFKGWKADDAYVQDNAIVTTNVVLKADYQVKTVKINFYDPMAVKPNVAIGTGTVTYGEILMKSTRTWDQARNNLNGHTGYDFNVWVDEEGNEYENDTPILEDDELINLTATYTPKTYTLTFKPDGGAFDDEGLATKTVTYGKEIGELPTGEQVKKPGYTLKNWKDGKGVVWDEDTVWTYAANGWVKADWEANKYTITFNTLGGTITNGITEKEVTYDQPIGTLPIVQKSGYKFKGWKIECKDKTEGYIYANVVFSEKSNVPAKNIVATADWEGYPYTITFNGNGGTNAVGTPTELHVNYGSPYNLGNGTGWSYAGHTFDGWYADEACTTLATEKLGEFYSLQTNTTVYAKWVAKTFIVTLKASHPTGDLAATDEALGIAPGYVTVKYNEPLSTAFTRAGIDLTELHTGGYKTTGKWYAERTGAGNVADPFVVSKEYELGVGKSLTKDITLYAGWEADKFTATFKVGGNDEDTYEFTYNEAVADAQFPNISKTGYTLSPWKYNNGGVLTELGDKWNFTSNVELFANWEPNHYKLTFVFDDADAVTGQNGTPDEVRNGAEYGTQINFPTATKKGYEFLGWFNEETGTRVDVADPVFYTFAGNVTLTAHWKAIKYTVQFKDKGELTDEKYIFYGQGKAVIAENDPTPAPGQKFLGWFMGDNQFTFTGKYQRTENIVIEAKYDYINYKLTFKYNDDANTVEYKPEYHYGDTIVFPTGHGTKAGYEWLGWAFEATTTILETGIKYNYVTDKVIEGKWKAIDYVITFDAKDGALPAGTADTKTVNYKQSVGNLPTPTLKGHDFLGWYYWNGTKDVLLQNNDPYPLLKSTTVIAKWNAQTYTINVYAGAGAKYSDDTTVRVGTVTYGQPIDTQYFVTPTRTGYKFDGWFYKLGLTGETEIGLTQTWTIVPGADEPVINITAKWAPEVYTLTFVEDDSNTEGGKVTGFNAGHKATNTKFNHNLATIKVTYGEAYTLHGKTVMEGLNTVGYEFLNWFDTNNTYATTGTWNVDLTPGKGEDGAGTLYANWKAIENIAITFDTSYVDGNGLLKASRATEIVMEETNPYLSTYDMPVAEGNLPKPTLAGYTFDGWFTADGHEVGPNAEYKYWRSATPAKLYAHWVPKTYPAAVAGLTFEFDQFGNIPVASKGQVQFTAPTNFTVTYDNKFAANTIAPTCKGYNFNGWKLGQVLYTADGNTYFEAALETIVGNELNVKFVAEWAPKTYTVTINANGGVLVGGTTPKANAKYAENLGFTAARTGYTLDGFYCGNIKVYGKNGNWVAPVTFDPTGNNATDAFTVVAKWIANDYIVTFNPGYGSVYPTSMAVTYDAPYGDLPTPSYGSYRFLYWVDQNNTIVKADSIYKFAGNSTLYARYKGSSSVTLDYRNLAGLDVVLGGTEEIFLGEVEVVEELVPTETVVETAPVEEVVEEAVVETPAEEVVETPTEEVVETPTEEVVETPTEEVVETPAEEATEETTEVVIENKTSAAADPIVATEEVLIKAAETGEVIVIKGDEDEEPKAVRVISINAEKGEVELEEVTEINPDTGAPVSANIAPAMFALLAAAAFAFGKRK